MYSNNPFLKRDKEILNRKIYNPSNKPYKMTEEDKLFLKKCIHIEGILLNKTRLVKNKNLTENIILKNKINEFNEIKS